MFDKLSELLRQRRRTMGYTRTQLARIAGVRISELAEIERSCDPEQTSIITLAALSCALELPTWRLIEMIEESDGNPDKWGSKDEPPDDDNGLRWGGHLRLV